MERPETTEEMTDMAKKQRISIKTKAKDKKPAKAMKAPKATKSPATKPRAGSVTDRSVARAISKLGEAHRLVRERGDVVMGLVGAVRDFGENAGLERMSNELCKRQILRDISLLQPVLESPVGKLPPEFKRFELLPLAILNCLRDVLDLKQDRVPGEEFETDVSRLARFDLSPESASPPESGLVKVRVVQSGWQRRGVQLSNAIVEVSQ